MGLSDNQRPMWAEAFENASWLALFKFISQIFSWVVTVLVARVLVPDDYGLMALATFFTGYASRFSELGLGTAIIQKPASKPKELSSVFWFSTMIALLFALSGIPFAYFSAYIFDEPRVIPLTLTVSSVFVFGGLQIVPLNLLKKRLEFKKIGFIQMVGVFVSCAFMLACAYMGGGVWALVGGFVILSLSRMVLTFRAIRWWPDWHFALHEARTYIKFGLLVALARSLSYIWQNSDRFFVGRAWVPKTVGYYTFAMQLSQLPTEKITVLINQVSFPVFSKLQHSKRELSRYYLKIVKITMMVVLPLFVGGFLTADELIPTVLGEKWVPIVFVFKFLCLAQIITSLNAVNSFVYYALGKPLWPMCFNGACAVAMSVSFYLAAKGGLNAMLIPWVTTYTIICAVWICVTVCTIHVSLFRYIRNIMYPCMSALVMAFCVMGFERVAAVFPYAMNAPWIMLLGKIIVGGISYVLCLLVIDREVTQDIKLIRSSRKTLSPTHG